jgi:hypothetical protein
MSRRDSLGGDGHEAQTGSTPGKRLHRGHFHSCPAHRQRQSMLDRLEDLAEADPVLASFGLLRTPGRIPPAHRPAARGYTGGKESHCKRSLCRRRREQVRSDQFPPAGKSISHFYMG